MKKFRLVSAEKTEALGAALAPLAKPGMIFALNGPLGAGKTCLARGLITALMPDRLEEIVSPTFTLVQTYETTAGMVWHFDCYRLKQPEDAIELGFEDALRDICIIEWPERLGSFLPQARVDITLAHDGEQREATVVGHGVCAEHIRNWNAAL
jgi:tRNA threonylcarbamoyladenosine biosynthesis protein TsaE